MGDLGQRIPSSAPSAHVSTASSDHSILEVRGRLDLTYKGITNWVFYARGDWTDGQDNMNAAGGLAPVPFFGTGMAIGPPTILQQTDDSYFFQKYSAGARWYPTRGVTLDAGGYYKLDQSITTTRWTAP